MAQTAPIRTTLKRPERRVGRPLSERLDRGYGAVVAAAVAAVGAFLALRLTAWPPHEDETLALYVGHGSLGDLADIVLGERGGAPLHYVFAWAVAHLGGGLGGLRLVSAVFALASIPLAAELVRRLTDRTTAALAALLVAANWVLLFHAVYGRMYALFLCTSLLSMLALLSALDRGGLRRWALWAGAILLCVATHPYGALVLASQGVFVLLARERLREAIPAGARRARARDPVLARRLRARRTVRRRRRRRRREARRARSRWRSTSATSRPTSRRGRSSLPVVLALAGFGGWVLWREQRRAALLTLAVVGTPTLAFLVARLGASTAPETRHLIFTLPFFAMLVASALVAIARSGRAGAERTAAVAAALLVVGGAVWAWQKTPLLFRGAPESQTAGRDAAADWLAAAGAPNDVLLGYEPVYLEAWERERGLLARGAPARGREARRADARGRPAPARPRDLGLRRGGHDERGQGAGDRPAPPARAGGVRGADVRAVPRAADARAGARRRSAGSSSPPRRRWPG